MQTGKTKQYFQSCCVFTVIDLSIYSCCRGDDTKPFRAVQRQTGQLKINSIFFFNSILFPLVRYYKLFIKLSE